MLKLKVKEMLEIKKKEENIGMYHLMAKYKEIYLEMFHLVILG